MCVCVLSFYTFVVISRKTFDPAKQDAPMKRTRAESPKTIEELDDKYKHIFAVSVNMAVSTQLQYIIE